MSDAIKNKLILFADNTQLIKKEFAWHGALTVRLAAFLYAQEGKRRVKVAELVARCVKIIHCKLLK